MKKYFLPTVAVIIVLIIFFRPAGFINTKGNGKIDIDFEKSEISAVIVEKTGESQYSERKIDISDRIIEVIKTLKPIRYVESMGLGNYYKISLKDSDNHFEVMFYIAQNGISETAAVRKLDENRNVEWTWECKVTEVEKLNQLLN